ncbi:MAG: hypothetical protein GY858_07630 [Candidatus Omnitrophica bacterium]|nr:hypothetical protein [Candidatus Omnitrophota bacterium]
MAKNVLLIQLCSLLALSTISCSPTPVSSTYSRNEIEDILKKICHQEFDIDVHAWNVGDTFWIYASFNKMLNDDNQLDKEAIDKIQKILLSIQRVVLSMDKPPKFYFFVAADIKIGADLFYIGFTPDMVKYQLGFISRGEIQERKVSNYLPNPGAIGDLEGKHIPKYELTMGEFISYLIRQNLQDKFNAEEFKKHFQVLDLRCYYYNKSLGIMFNIKVIDEKEGLPSPFEEAIKTVKKYLTIYGFKDVIEIEINDTANKKRRLYTLNALMED